jgi:hypothetical protein
MTGLISATLKAERPGITIATASGPASALRTALSLAGPADPVLFVYEKLAPAQEALAALGAIAAP